MFLLFPFLFLNNGKTFANFHSLGKIPVLKDWLKITVNQGETIGPDILRILVDIPSNPEALQVANEIKILKTSDEQVFSGVNSVLDGVIYFSNGIFVSVVELPGSSPIFAKYWFM